MCVKETYEQMTWTNAGCAQLCVGSSKSRWHVQLVFSNKPMSSVYCSLRRCRLDIQDCTCDTLLTIYNKKAHDMNTQQREKTPKRNENKPTKIIWEDFLISMLFLSMFDEFSPGSSQKLARKPRSCQKLENPLLTTLLIQILTEKSWHENQDLAKNWKILFLMLV